MLCISGHACDLQDGIEKASDIIDSGRPIKKLKAWVAHQNSDASSHLEKLEMMLETACN